MAKATFTEEDLNTKNVDKLLKMLPETTQNLIRVKMDDILKDWLLNISCCESPIEQLLVLALDTHRETCSELSGWQYVVEPHSLIKCGSRRFKVDILIQCMVGEIMHRIVVECDGHKYHETSKIQAKKDKQKDRLLIKYGYKVIRFTGSEIFNSPDKCARETLSLIFPDFPLFDVE